MSITELLNNFFLSKIGAGVLLLILILLLTLIIYFSREEQKKTNSTKIKLYADDEKKVEFVITDFY